MSKFDGVATRPPAFPSATSVSGFRDAVARVEARIAIAAARVDRSADEVRLLPISKTVEAGRVRLAVESGLTMLGENKVQEAKAKAADLADTAVTWSIVGHLQTNKAKDVVAFASELQALDSLRVAEVLDRRLQAAGRSLDVLVQVNTSGEDQKFGIPPDELATFLASLAPFSSLRVQGLMTLAMLTDDVSRIRPCFALLRDLRDRARQDHADLIGPGELSMGMSGDFEVAVEEGATCVRVGQAIFGARSTPDSFYWPAARDEAR